MNRIIKFRVWNKLESKMEVCEEGFSHDATKLLRSAWGVQWPIMQFTNQIDSKGREVYEGDLLKISMGGEVQNAPFVVENLWELEVGIQNSDSYMRIDPDFEIIGNIYENPELNTKSNE